MSELHVRHVAPGELTPWPENPRTISKAELTKLQRSIRAFGFVQPVVVNRRTGQLVAGHQRLSAAQALGLPTVPVVYVDLPKEQATALALALNKIGGEWALPKLGELLDELRQLPDIDVGLSGFDEKEVDDLLSELERQQLPGPFEETYLDAAEALQAERTKAPTRVRPGETWHLGGHRLCCGDCLEEGALLRLLGNQKVDYLLTDPPYGIAYESTMARRGRRKRPLENDGVAEFDGFLTRAMPAIKEVMKPGAVLHWFAGGSGPEPVLGKALLAIAEHLNLLNVIVWDKVDPGLGWRWRRSWEAIIEAANGRPTTWHGGKDSRDILRYPRAIPGADDHPTPKPIPLLEELIRAAAPTRGLILDPFLGAGSTLIAAERTGRTCYGIEIERRYCDLTAARWETLTGEQAHRLREEAPS